MVSILLTTGSPWSGIAIGKGLAVLLPLIVVAFPGLVLIAIPWLENDRPMRPVDLGLREIVMMGALTAYFVGWIGLTILVSSKSKSMIGSFSILVTLWSVVALVLPRIAGDVAHFVSPLPTHAEVRLEKENAIQDSNQSSARRAKAQT